MSVNIRRVFKKNCGPGAKFLSYALENRGEHNVVRIRFFIVPEQRTFDLDGVIHGETDADLERAVLRIAYIAETVREHIKPDKVQA
jgi:hypothetical protein